MLICCFLNAIYQKVMETKLVNSYGSYVRKKSKTINIQHNNILYVQHLHDSGLMTDYEKLSKA